MSLSRQQKRATMRRLNDPAKARIQAQRIEEAQYINGMNRFESMYNARLGKQSELFICWLVLIVTSAACFIS